MGSGKGFERNNTTGPVFTRHKIDHMEWNVGWAVYFQIAAQAGQVPPDDSCDVLFHGLSQCNADMFNSCGMDDPVCSNP
jgi:hypothetical protein